MTRSTAWPAASSNARRFGRVLGSTTCPAAQLPPASGGDPARTGRDAAGRFTAKNPWARQAKVRAGPRGALVALEAKADPAWQAARRWARRAAQHRIREYAQAHGSELSSGVCRLLSDAAELSGDATYLRARAARDDNPELLRLAAQLVAGARQAERDAWELAARERAARDLAPGDDETSQAWLEQAEGGGTE